MLDKSDLKAIGALIDEKIDKKIDELAIIIAKGFERVDQRFDALEKRMDSLEKRMGAFEGRMDSLEMEMTSLRKRMDNLEQKMDRIEKRSLEDDNALTKEVVQIDRRVTILEKHLKIA